MKCVNCGQASDWLGPRGDWTPVHPDERPARQLQECDVCGHRQLTR